MIIKQSPYSTKHDFEGRRDSTVSEMNSTIADGPKQGIGDLVTILVPTYNRYRFLKRLVRYYVSTGFPAPLKLLDSSDSPEEDIELQHLVSTNTHISQHLFPPDTHPVTKQHIGLQEVNTPFVVVWADDDFLVPWSVLDGVQFLQNSPDHSIVHGQSGIFRKDLDSELFVGSYRQLSYTNELASDRLVSFLSNYSVTVYSVHRTHDLRTNMRLVEEQGLRYRWAELCLGSLSAIRGKIHKCDRLYLLKQVHESMDSWRGSAHPGDFFDNYIGWLMDTEWGNTYLRFRNTLATELAVTDSISLDLAIQTVQQAFWAYAAYGLLNNYSSRYLQKSVGTRVRIRNAAKRLPFAKQIWNNTLSHLPWGGGKFSLQALNRGTSPYYKDFSLIYRSIVDEHLGA